MVAKGLRLISRTTAKDIESDVEKAFDVPFFCHDFLIWQDNFAVGGLTRWQEGAVPSPIVSKAILEETLNP